MSEMEYNNFTSFNFSVFNMTADTPYALPLSFKIVILGLYAITTTVSIFGNIVVLLTIRKNKRKGEAINNYFFASFAISDIMMSSMCIPLTCISSILYNWWPFGAALCPIISYLQSTIVLQRSFNMVAVSFERHQAVANWKNQPLKKRTVKVVIVLSWVFALVVAIPTAIFSKVVYLSFEPGINGLCFETWNSAQVKTIYSCIILLLQYGAPLVIMAIMYSNICYIIWNNKIPGEKNEKRDERILKTKKKSVKMLAALVSVFIITWLPLHILTVVGDTEPSIYNDMNIHMMWLVFHWLALSNSGTGCIIFIAMSASFKNGLKCVVTKITCGLLFKQTLLLRKTSYDCSLISERQNRSQREHLRRSSFVSLSRYRVDSAEEHSSV